MWGKSEKIMQLFADGLPQAEIARRLDCTTSNVCQTISRHSKWSHRIGPLPLEHQLWLIRQGLLSAKSPARLAAELLRQAIEQRLVGEENAVK